MSSLCNISLSWVLLTPFQCSSRGMTIQSALCSDPTSTWRAGRALPVHALLGCLFSRAQHRQIGIWPRNATLAAPLSAKKQFQVYGRNWGSSIDCSDWMVLPQISYLVNKFFLLKRCLRQIGGVILQHNDSKNTQEMTCKKLLLSDSISKNCWGWTVIKLNGRPECICSLYKPHLLPYKSDIFLDGWSSNLLKK